MINGYLFDEVRVHRHPGNSDVRIKVKRPPDAIIAIKRAFGITNETSWPVEHYGVVCLDRQNYVCGIFLLGKGDEKKVNINIKDVFIAALACDAMGIILFHTHPEQSSPLPSDNDLIVTRKLIELCSLMGIYIFDHLILGKGYYVSLFDRKDLIMNIKLPRS